MQNDNLKNETPADTKPVLWAGWISTEKELSLIDIENPDFKNTSKVHDWRNYIPYDWQKNWGQFTERERQIIAVMAQSQADNEEWD